MLATGLRVGHLFTLRHPELAPPGAPEDWDDEADTADTHEAIAATWRALGHRVAVSLDTAVEPLSAFEALRGVDLAVNLAVGTRGRSREAQTAAVLEALGVPYLGSPPLALALAQDKPVCGAVLRQAGVPVPAAVVLQAPGAAPGLPFPLFVKPAAEGSSKGVRPTSLVRDAAALAREVERIAAGYRQPALAQVYVPGREFCVAVLGDRALPVLEVRVAAGAGRDFVTAADKEGDIWRHLPVECPAAVPAALADQLADLALRACRALGVRHMARCDFRWPGDGPPLLIDVNPVPTLRPGGSFYVAAARAAGYDYASLWSRLLGVAGCGNRPLHSARASC